MPSKNALSTQTIESLTAAREDKVGHARWDSEEVHQRSIFYAGNRVFLNPNLKIGNPDALTPDPSLKVPTTRAAKTENYKQNMKTAAQREKRSKMTKKEREEEQLRAEKALTRFVKADTTKKARLPTVQPKKQMGFVNLLDSMVEDDSSWEQHTQAGCTFWRNIITREIRVDNLILKGNRKPVKDVYRKKYPIGTGAPLFDANEYARDRSWLTSKGMPLPAIRPSNEFVFNADDITQNAAALLIQEFFRRRKANRVRRAKAKERREKARLLRQQLREEEAKEREAREARQKESGSSSIGGGGGGGASVSSTGDVSKRLNEYGESEGADEEEDDEDFYDDEESYEDDYDEEST